MSPASLAHALRPSSDSPPTKLDSEDFGTAAETKPVGMIESRFLVVIEKMNSTVEANLTSVICELRPEDNLYAYMGVGGGGGGGGGGSTHPSHPENLGCRCL